MCAVIPCNKLCFQVWFQAQQTNLKRKHYSVSLIMMTQGLFKRSMAMPGTKTRNYVHVKFHTESL